MTSVNGSSYTDVPVDHNETWRCKAAVLTAYNTPLEIKEIEVGPLRDGECLVQIVADLHMIKGDWTVLSPLPCVLGHEGSGIVVRCGKGVRNVREGDHVVTIFQKNCGRCEKCQVGRPMLCQGHQSPTGTLHDGQTRIKIDGKPAYHMAGVSCFSELAVIHEEQLLCISPKVPLDRAALVGCSVMTGYGAAVNTAGIKPGDDTCIIGCGGVGLNIIQGARALSASKIIGIDILDNKLDYAMEFGATHVINAKEVQDVVAEVLRITEGKGVDYAFDAIGSARTVENCFNMVKTGGTAIEVGIAPETQTAAISAFTLALQEKTLKGSFYGSARPQTDMLKILDLYAQKRLKLDELVSSTISLDRINEGMDLLRSGTVARTLVLMRHEDVEDEA